MAPFKEAPQKYLVKQAILAFRNMVRNYDAKVYKEDYFTIVDACVDHEIGLKLVEEICAPKDLDYMKHVRLSAGRLDFSKPLKDIFLVLWNSDLRDKSRAILDAICSCRIRDIGRVDRSDIARKRLHSIVKGFELSKLEGRVLTVAYVERKTCFSWPCLQFPSEQPILYAMALDCPLHEVTKVLSADGKLRQYGLLDEHLVFNDSDFGDFMNGTDSDFMKKHRSMLALMDA